MSGLSANDAETVYVGGMSVETVVWAVVVWLSCSLLMALDVSYDRTVGCDHLGSPVEVPGIFVTMLVWTVSVTVVH